MAFERLNGTLRRLFGRLRIEAGKSGTSTDAALSVNQDRENAGLLMDLQVAGTSKFKIDKSGYVSSLIFAGNNGVVGSLGSGGNEAKIAFEYGYDGSSGIKFYLGNVSYPKFRIIDSATATPLLKLSSTGALSWARGASTVDHPPDLLLDRDAAGTLAQRNGSNAQTTNLYATYASATSYHRLATTTARTTLSAVSGATVTASALIPAGANLLGVTTRVNTALGTSNGTTGYAVGTAADPNLWGDVTAVAAGTASKAQAIASQSSGYTADDALGFSVSTRDVVITAAGGNFDGTGAIEIAVYYSLAEAD